MTSEPTPTSPRRESVLAAGVNLVVEAATVEVVSAMRDAGVRSIVLKGPPLVQWLYGVGSTRYSTDVDLLVAPEDLPEAEGVLSGLGFTVLPIYDLTDDRPKHARLWEGSTNAIDVDLHRTLAGIGAPPEKAWTLLSREAEWVELGGIEVEVLGSSGRAVHVVLHAAQHGAAYPKALEDLARAFERVSADVWHNAARLAASLYATEGFAVGLSLLPAGQAVLSDLELPEPRPSTHTILRSETAPDLALGIEWLSRLPGIRRKLRFVARKVVPPPEWMRAWAPIARRGRVGLAASYIWRVLWLIVRAGPGLRAWARARERARGAE